ncbi:hypothetical protein Syun_003885 [Stephania yunnanensis]|uniref:Uncharacterized protein n=1 Tax=Stephania yunnanensis TaxID=152371 RepID=A0AAP0Q0N0_9MAGN
MVAANAARRPRGGEAEGAERDSEVEPCEAMQMREMGVPVYIRTSLFISRAHIVFVGASNVEASQQLDMAVCHDPACVFSPYDTTANVGGISKLGYQIILGTGVIKIVVPICALDWISDPISGHCLCHQPSDGTYANDLTVLATAAH